MVTVIVLSPSLDATAPVQRAAEAVARSLCALVRASVEGIVRDALIIGPAEDQLAEIADEAGCSYIEASSAQEGFARAVAQSRSDIAFVLEGGYAPQQGFVEEAGDLLHDAGFRGALLRRSPDSLMTWLAPSLARPVGAFAARDDLRGAAPRDLAELIRRLKIRHTLTARAHKIL
ncbi:transposase [Rhodoblastus acidophilus]|uniref:Transposase n=1 Tax=Candidatus Rhodoblastus alkanivorans TaxID=2954117 RepID=A0ABS9Z9U3_9HYPH|nr:transposase [Candidatus Rhodoblastus alkanivorans]MCI4677075.1 transposase [Candidatus Rhodoblastus alkanivorans]MCI4684428.1 transposase [Candidatus Rhodoblastus alkanivorans]MDI4641749.1 transposase [Rhodoblastus acidophilus]